MTTGPDITATFCATLVDEWTRGGVTDVVVCPGSRSTPLALAVAGDERLRVHVHHDERSAAFVALGLGLATGRPAVVVTTSGTAVAELHPAISEANQSGVPLIAATADRPPELQGVGAPQTIDQTQLFGGAVRWFAQPGVPDDLASASWRALGARSVVRALGPRPGPVHLNLAFREPLLGTPGALPPGRDGAAPWTWEERPPGRLRHGALGALQSLLEEQRGVIVAGACGSDDAEPLADLSRALGWPLIADPRSGIGHPAIGAADAILRHEPTAERLRPDVVLRVGQPPVSKVLNAWLDSSDAIKVLVHGYGAVIDPSSVLDRLIVADVGEVAQVRPSSAPGATSSGGGSTLWSDSWQRAEAAAQGAIDAVLAGHDAPTEPGVARTLLGVLPDGADLVVSSSMPVRDLEWFGRPRVGVRVLANRGANGIDGVMSTAVGVALGSRRPTVALLGDVAFLHDTNGMLGLARRDVDLTVVVVDNDGGGIFSFLPQSQSLPAEQFEQLFGTPHGVDLAVLASAHGLPATRPMTSSAIGPAVAEAVALGGPRVVLVQTDRNANVDVHASINSAVVAALDAL